MDPIADMITRIRNALNGNNEAVQMPYSKERFALAEVLKKEGWVDGVKEIEDKKGFKQLEISLKYNIDGSSYITKLKRISKLGRRVYAGKKEIPYVLNGYGIAVMSTSEGVMTNKEAKKKGIGGEVLFEVY